MSPERLESQEIWKRVGGAERLFEIYGYFPGLHDAIIENIGIDFGKKAFLLTVRYSNLTEETDKSVRTKFTICWRNIQNADFRWYGEDLYGLQFSKSGDFIKTTFEKYPPGFSGELTAGEIEILNIEIDPEKDENNRGIINFSIS